MAITNPRLLSKPEAAAYCGCDSLKTFKDRIDSGLLPGPIPGTRSWDRKALHYYLSELDGEKTEHRSKIAKEQYRQRPGYIYFMEADEYMKIGWTQSRDVSRRLNSMQTGCPHIIKLAYMMPGSMEQEFELHSRFKEFHVHGEWFRITPRLVRLIRKLMGGANGP